MAKHTGGKQTTFYGVILKVTHITPAVLCQLSHLRACPALDRCTENVEPTFLLEKCQEKREKKRRREGGRARERRDRQNWEYI